MEENGKKPSLFTVLRRLFSPQATGNILDSSGIRVFRRPGWGRGGCPAQVPTEGCGPAATLPLMFPSQPTGPRKLTPSTLRLRQAGRAGRRRRAWPQMGCTVTHRAPGLPVCREHRRLGWKHLRSQDQKALKKPSPARGSAGAREGGAGHEGEGLGASGHGGKESSRGPGRGKRPSTSTCSIV